MDLFFERPSHRRLRNYNYKLKRNFTITLTHDFEQNGLALSAKITIGKNIKVDASITNNSGETIVYNGRCGIPFTIFVKKEDAYSHLVAIGEKEVVCDDVLIRMI